MEEFWKKVIRKVSRGNTRIETDHTTVMAYKTTMPENGVFSFVLHFVWGSMSELTEVQKNPDIALNLLCELLKI